MPKAAALQMDLLNLIFGYVTNLYNFGYNGLFTFLSALNGNQTTIGTSCGTQGFDVDGTPIIASAAPGGGFTNDLPGTFSVQNGNTFVTAFTSMDGILI